MLFSSFLVVILSLFSLQFSLSLIRLPSNRHAIHFIFGNCLYTTSPLHFSLQLSSLLSPTISSSLSNSLIFSLQLSSLLSPTLSSTLSNSLLFSLQLSSLLSPTLFSPLSNSPLFSLQLSPLISPTLSSSLSNSLLYSLNTDTPSGYAYEGDLNAVMKKDAINGTLRNFDGELPDWKSVSSSLKKLSQRTLGDV